MIRQDLLRYHGLLIRGQIIAAGAYNTDTKEEGEVEACLFRCL